MNKERVLMIACLLALAGVLVSGPARSDQVINDDLIVDGSLCVGFDCVNGESFGFDTIRLKENNLRIKFEDTSSTASFPTTDWQITINDSTNGGRSYFGVDNASSGNPVLRIFEGDGAAVVIGEGSTDGGDNTLSVGSATERRRIVNVAAGTADSDAATVGQLNEGIAGEATARSAADTALQADIAGEASARSAADAALQRNIDAEAASRQAADTALQANIESEAAARASADSALHDRIDAVESRLDGVGALASAFSALVPNARAAGNTQVSLGLGNYGGASAVAAGMFHYVTSSVLLNAGLSSSFNGHGTAARAGVTFGW